MITRIFFFLVLSLCLPMVLAQDFDLDTVTDAIDNCVKISNQNQIDTDADGWGNACDSDYNNDGQVNFADYLLLTNGFLGNDQNLDANNDGIINYIDIFFFTERFLQPPGPAGYAHWNVPMDGDWANADNWYPAIVPPPEATVFIDQPGDITVTYSAPGMLSVAAMVLNNALTLTGPEVHLKVSGDVEVNAPLVLIGGSLDIAGSLAINSTGTFSLLDGELRNATLSAVNQPIQILTSGSPTLNGVTLATDLQVTNSELTVKNGLTLDNTNIALNANSAAAHVNFVGTQSLGGEGAIIFNGIGGNLGTQIRLLPGGGELTIESGITVQTGTSGGGLTAVAGSLIFQGTLMSNLNAERISVSANEARFEGPLMAIDGGELHLDGNWTNAPGNTISAIGADLSLKGFWINHGIIDVSNSSVQIGRMGNPSLSNSGVINLVNSPLVIDGVFTRADLGNFNTDSTFHLLGDLDNTGQTLDLDAMGGPLFTVGAGASIMGGTIIGSAPFIVGPPEFSFLVFTLDSVTLQTDLNVLDDVDVRVENGLVLDNADVLLFCNESYARVSLVGAQTLSGSGEIKFNGTTLEDTQCSVSVSTLPGNTVTIDEGISVRTLSSGGRLGLSVYSLDMRGDVYSSLNGRKVTLLGDTLNLFGSVHASNGGEVVINGQWQAADSSLISVLDGSLELLGNWTNNGVIEATNSTVYFADSYVDTWINNNTIQLVSSPLRLYGQYSLTDLGAFTSDDEIIIGGWIDNIGQVLDLDMYSPANLVFPDSAQFNGGTITGSSAMVIGPDVSWVQICNVNFDTDVDVMNNAELRLCGTPALNNTTIRLNAAAGFSHLQLWSNTTLAGTGEIHFAGTSQSADANWIKLRDSANAQSTIGSNITVRTVTANGRLGGSENGSDHSLSIRGDAVSAVDGLQLSLHGRFSLEGSAVAQEGGMLSFDGSWDVSESGTMTLSGAQSQLNGDWTNYGLITATNSMINIGEEELLIFWQNFGTFNLIASPLNIFAYLGDIGTGSIVTDSDVRFSGIIENAGRTLDTNLLGGSHFTFADGAMVIGGTIVGVAPFSVGPDANTVTFDGVTLAADMLIRNGSQLQINNDLTLNDGSIALSAETDIAYLNIADNGTISGNGELVFAGSTPDPSLNWIRAADMSTQLTFGGGVSIRTDTASGRIGNNFSALEIDGAIRSESATHVIEVFDSLVVLNGRLFVADNATIDFQASELHLLANSLTEIEIGPFGGGLINFSNPLSVNGSLNFTLADGFLPGACQSFPIMNYPSVFGSFDSVTGPIIDFGQTFSVDFQAGSAVALAPPC